MSASPTAPASSWRRSANTCPETARPFVSKNKRSQIGKAEQRPQHRGIAIRCTVLRIEPMTGHAFGGPWTEIKLDAVQYYLECYSKALKRVGFDLTYVDAFAGTGSRDVQRTV